MKLKLRVSDITDGKWIGLVVIVLMWKQFMYNSIQTLHDHVDKQESLTWNRIICASVVCWLTNVFTLSAKHGVETILIATKPKVMYERYNITPVQKINKGQPCNSISTTCYTQHQYLKLLDTRFEMSNVKLYKW